MFNGKLIILSAPSGAGKTTIVKKILERCKNELAFSISATSRTKRSNEIDGKDYYFLSESDFKCKVSNNEFIEWEEVYKDLFYGTLKSEVEKIWKNNQHVIFDIDVKGGLNLKQQFNSNALAIFIKPPSEEILKQRLINRNTESDENLTIRLNKVTEELTFAPQFDVIIVNDTLEQAIQEVELAIKQFIGNQ